MTAPVLTNTPAPVAPAPKPPSSWQVLRQGVRATFAGTPGRLRIYGALAIVASLVFGVLSLVAASARAGAIADARSDAAQLVRIQNIRINLVTADASLTNAFLIGGLEPPAERAAYETGIDNATNALTAAAAAKAADADTLDKVNTVVAAYTGLVESARANNRQGYPIGAAYLRQATSLLRNDALPVLEDLAKTEQKRVDNAYSSSALAVIWLVIGIVVAVAALLAAQLFLFRRTRRVFNLPLVAATAIVVVVGVALAATMIWSQSKAKSTRTGAYFATLEMGTARVDAFDAKSAESLTLINRGSGQAYEQRYQQVAGDAAAILDDAAQRGGSNARAAQEAFTKYNALHQQIRALDDSGSWDQAVAIATGTDSGQANALFGQFDTASGKALDASAKTLRDDLGSARSPLLWLGWVALAGGALAALAAWRGIGERLREYR
jgi:hypothetical protein